MIVVDTNLVAYLLLPGEGTADAERVRAADRDWIAPTLLRHELLNVVAAQVKQSQLDRNAALRLFRHGLTLVQFKKLESYPLAILNMCQSTDLSTFELEFVWLAIELDVPLVTMNQKIVQAFPQVAVHASEFGKAKV